MGICEPLFVVASGIWYYQLIFRAFRYAPNAPELTEGYSAVRNSIEEQQEPAVSSSSREFPMFHP